LATQDDDWLDPHHPAHLRSGGHRLHSQPQQPPPAGGHRHRQTRGSGGRNGGSGGGGSGSGGSGGCSPGRSSGGGDRSERRGGRHVTREEIAQLPDFSDNLPARMVKKWPS